MVWGGENLEEFRDRGLKLFKSIANVALCDILWRFENSGNMNKIVKYEWKDQTHV